LDPDRRQLFIVLDFLVTRFLLPLPEGYEPVVDPDNPILDKDDDKC
jgi:hypothetical protein